jgi:UDP-N-acetylmuramoylalanine--D-glutamate ligase
MTSVSFSKQSSSGTPAARERWLVFGMGKTGLSCARFLSAQGHAVTVIDTRNEPPEMALLKQLQPEISCRCGPLDIGVLKNVDALALSPGIALVHPLVRAARDLGLPIVGDIELFARVVSAPYVAITGSNGKSTVTTLVAQIIASAEQSVKAGANLGTPALDLLAPPIPDYFVLELSSFQLEVTTSLAAQVACLLNISPDHLDRHGTLAKYAAAKSRILCNARAVVLNADDSLVASLAPTNVPVHWVSLQGARPGCYSVAVRDGQRYLAHDEQMLLPCAELRIRGAHNEFNALAALAITDCLGISRASQLAVLREFMGLEHRCRLVAEHAGVSWFNDSKGTNVGASVAAVTGIFNDRTGVLIAGGQGKGADFTALRAALQARVHTVILLGEDALRIDAAIADLVRTSHAHSMQQAVAQASACARPGDAVLLSPACASFDMFQDYAARGRAFEAAVRELIQR